MLTFLTGLTPASATALGLVPVGAIGLVLSFASADARYFDPRPAVRRSLETGRLQPLWQVAVYAGRDLIRTYAWTTTLLRLHAAQLRDRTRLLAVRGLLVLLLRLTAPNGDAR